MFLNPNPNLNTKITKTIIYKPDAVIEGWHSKGSAPMYALLLPPHPTLGGSISNNVLRRIHQAFTYVGFSTLRINFRGVGMSHSNTSPLDDSSLDRSFDLQDALDSLDWLSTRHSEPRILWIAGFGYGAHITINAAMRRPGVHGFVAVTPYPDGEFEFNMLTPCPNGLVINGSNDQIIDPNLLKKIINELSNQKGCSIEFHEIAGADHTYTNHGDQLIITIAEYLNKVLASEMITERSGGMNIV